MHVKSREEPPGCTRTYFPAFFPYRNAAVSFRTSLPLGACLLEKRYYLISTTMPFSIQGTSSLSNISPPNNTPHNHPQSHPPHPKTPNTLPSPRILPLKASASNILNSATYSPLATTQSPASTTTGTAPLVALSTPSSIAPPIPLRRQRAQDGQSYAR